MEAEVIKRHIPELVTAISDCVQPVSDQCLAKGLIPDSVYNQVLESGGTSEDKARTLILAVKKSIERDSRCFELLLKVLEEMFPRRRNDSLLNRIRTEYDSENGNTRRDVVSVSPNEQVLPSDEFSRQVMLQQIPVTYLGRLEESIRQHAEACVEKRLLKEQLEYKSEENEKLKKELQELRRKNQEETDLASVTSQRISACEAEMAQLKEKIDAVESTIEDQGMRMKRGKSVIGIKMKEFLQAVQEERNTFEKKLEEKKDEVMQAHKKWRESEKEFETKLKEKDDEVQALHRKHEKERGELNSKMKDLEHRVELYEKDLTIKKLKLEYYESSKAVPVFSHLSQDEQAIDSLDFLRHLEDRS